MSRFNKGINVVDCPEFIHDFCDLNYYNLLLIINNDFPQKKFSFLLNKQSFDFVISVPSLSTWRNLLSLLLNFCSFHATWLDIFCWVFSTTMQVFSVEIGFLFNNSRILVSSHFQGQLKCCCLYPDQNHFLKIV